MVRDGTSLKMGSWRPLKNGMETQRKVPGKMTFGGEPREGSRKRSWVECLDDDLW